MAEEAEQFVTFLKTENHLTQGKKKIEMHLTTISLTVCEGYNQ